MEEARNATNKTGQVSWIKIVTNIFDDEKIMLIEALPEGDSLIVIWFKLLCLAGKQNNNGVFMIADRIPYTDEMFATIFRRPLSVVRMALKVFEQFRMIEIIDDVVIIPNWEKHQNLDKLEMAREATRKRVAKHREKQRLLAAGGSNECNVTGNVTDDVTGNASSNVTETQSSADREEKRREEKRREDIYIGDDLEDKKEKSASKKPVRHKYGEYKNVLLSDEDLAKLKAEFPDDWEERIEKLSEGIAMKGYKYANHLAVIRNWARGENEENGKGNGHSSPASGKNKGGLPRQTFDG